MNSPFVLIFCGVEPHDFQIKHRGHSITLPKTNMAPEMDGWKMSGTFWEGLFSGAMWISGRVDT